MSQNTVFEEIARNYHDHDVYTQRQVAVAAALQIINSGVAPANHNAKGIGTNLSETKSMISEYADAIQAALKVNKG